MGNATSSNGSRERYCLVDFPKVKTRPQVHLMNVRLQVVVGEEEEEEELRLIPEACYPYNDTLQEAVLQDDVLGSLGSNEKALITSIKLVSVHNELQVPISLTIRGLFEVTQETVVPAAHPDNTGKVQLVLEPRKRGPIDTDRQLLYACTATAPSSPAQGSIRYAGLEQTILEPHSVSLYPSDEEKEEQEEEDWEVLQEDDILLKFIMTHREQFPFDRSILRLIRFQEEDARSYAQRHYQVSSRYLDNIRQFFKEAVFPILHYTRFEALSLDLRQSDDTLQQIRTAHPPQRHNGSFTTTPCVLFTLQLEYLVISTHISKGLRKTF